MKQDDFRALDAMTESLAPGVFPAADQTSCSLRKTAANLAAGRKDSKDLLTRCEAEAFLSLASGHRVVVLDHETGEGWQGEVDAPFPEYGFVWVFTDLGERKLFDITRHTVWPVDELHVCDRIG